MTDADTKEAARYWTDFLAGKNWRDLTNGTDPKSVGCGEVYELPLHSRPGEEICIADMHGLTVSEPTTILTATLRFTLSWRARPTWSSAMMCRP